MACPFFAPSRRLENTVWLLPPRYPLGDLFSGTCHASSSNLTEGHHDDPCNFGYARGRCDRFPGGNAADAVRFSVTEDTPNRLLVALEYVIADARLDGPPISDVLVQQARAFLESYLSRRTRSART